MRPIGFEPISEWLKVICITLMLKSLHLYKIILYKWITNLYNKYYSIDNNY